MDPLFPELPEDLSALSDEELASLLSQHEVAAKLIDDEDEDYTMGLGPDEVLDQLARGIEQIGSIRAEQQARVEAQEAYLSRKSDLLSALNPVTDEDPGDESDAEVEEESTEEETQEELVAEAEVEADEEPAVEEEVEEKVLVTASAQPEKKAEKRSFRRPPSPSAERQLRDTEAGAVLTAAAGLQDIAGGKPLNRMEYARTVGLVAERWGAQTKSIHGVEEKRRIGGVQYRFPEDRILDTGSGATNSEKIRKVIPGYIPGLFGQYGAKDRSALVASGGLCAPLEPIYTMPNFASLSRPVRDALPSFQASRGGVNVPAATSIGDITSAISSISEASDAAGGSAATKSCQDLDCPDYTEVAVQILSHCREYGNLNARAWPEKIAHENDLTMAAHARTAEAFLLGRIKALSINVTATQVLGAYSDLVDVLEKATSGIRYRLRMDPGVVFSVLAPAWLSDLLVADTASTQFDRFQNEAQLDAHLASLGISLKYVLDDVGSGTSQGFADEAAGAVDEFPAVVQYALYVEGSFIHVDGGSLELGIVRDSTLNSTNDFQLFGESFENVARLGPAQGALWISQTICPSGEFPELSAARC